MGSGIVKVGAYNSILRITRIPLVLCFSGVKDKVRSGEERMTGRAKDGRRDATTVYRLPL